MILYSAHIFLREDKWNGACLDTSAQTTVTGLKQAKAYCKFMRISIQLKYNKNKYRFVVDRQPSLNFNYP